MPAIFRLTKAQTVARRKLAPGQTLTLCWGRGTGKSWFMRYVAYSAIDQGKNHIALVSPTLKQCKQNHLQWALEELGSEWAHLGARWNTQSSQFHFANGSTLQFFGCTPRPSRGPRFDIVLVDECDDIDPRLFHGIIVPWLSATWSKRLMVLAGTPTRGRFGLLWEHRSFGLNPSYHHHHVVTSTAYDSPEITSRDAVMKAKETTERTLFAREWLCDFDSGNGAVFPMFDRALHVKKFEHHRPRRVIVGCDHGFRDPTAFIPLAQTRSGQDTSVHAMDEYYSHGALPREHKRKALEWASTYQGSLWYYDPSRPETIADYRNAGISITKANNSRLEGIATVAEFLSPIENEDGVLEPRLYIDPKCVNLIHELETYRRKEDPRTPGRYLEEVVDKDDHAIDALRYALHTEFGRVSSERTTR